MVAGRRCALGPIVKVGAAIGAGAELLVLMLLSLTLHLDVSGGAVLGIGLVVLGVACGASCGGLFWLLASSLM